MLAFWIAAALLCAASVALVLARAAKPSSAAGEDPELAVYRRHLAELDEMKAQGLLDDPGYAAARAEAGRRLLAANERASGPTAAPEMPADPTRQRRTVLAVAAGAALAAAAVYLAVGSPDRPDQPYAARLQKWLAADPDKLGPAETAARLKYGAAQSPNSPRAWFFLGYSYRVAQDPVDAVQAFEKSLALDPRQADAWAGLGEALTATNEGQIGPDARDAFERALKLDPASPIARLYLGEADIQAGRVEDGLNRWRALAASLPANDPRRAEMDARIAEASKAGARRSSVPAAQAPMIRAMVERQAEALKAHPDDVEGWARLVRSYAVLGDDKAEAAALAQARRIFKDRPQELARVEKAATAAP
jgi:cytochrome c-type biogenesis protein CcmH